MSFARPLWIDLGGIAKGYAVDRAVTTLLQHGPTQACVNAGGDLRVTGAAGESVRLASGDSGPSAMVELEEGSAASSRFTEGVHIRGRPGTFVCVTAPRCMRADALTKVVMALGDRAAPALARTEARALMLEPGREWQSIGGTA